jgi:hypothetical protein
MKPQIIALPNGGFKIKLNEKTTITTKPGKNPEEVLKKYQNIPQTILTGAAAKYTPHAK